MNGSEGVVDPTVLSADIKKRIEGLLDGSRQPTEQNIPEPVVEASSVDGKSIELPKLVTLPTLPILPLSMLATDSTDLEPGEEPPLDEAQLNELMIVKAVAAFRLKQIARDK